MFSHSFRMVVPQDIQWNHDRLQSIQFLKKTRHFPQ
jgi:hypothetical protein